VPCIEYQEIKFADWKMDLIQKALGIIADKKKQHDDETAGKKTLTEENE
jgi:hypothetical protein